MIEGAFGRWRLAVALAASAALVVALASVGSAGAHDVKEGEGSTATSSFTLGLADGLFMPGTSAALLGDEHGPVDLVSGAGLEPAPASHPDDDFHSDNFSMLKRVPIEYPDDSDADTNVERARGSDLAFQGDLLVAGSYEGIGFFEIGRKAEGGLEQISFLHCPGSQGDVSILGRYVFVSIDSPSSNSAAPGAACNPGTAEGSSQGKEGIRILDISNVENPRQVGFVETECGSHTHTLIPGEPKSHIYVSSYPLTQTDNCTEENHPEGEISVIEFKNSDPAKPTSVEVVDILSASELVTPDTIGCHDIGVLPEKDLAAAACLGAFAILDISDPADPKTLSTVQNPAIELDHSAALTWDGQYAVIGDEHAGAAGGGGCSPDQSSPVGAMWFYDITERDAPVLKGHYSLPRVPPLDSAEEIERFRCTTHNYMVLPMKDDRYVAVSPYYSGGLSVVDFTNPEDPKELGHYLPREDGVNPDMWSGYWYRGRIYTNENASRLGVGVFEMKDLGKQEVDDLGPRLNPQTQVR